MRGHTGEHSHGDVRTAEPHSPAISNTISTQFGKRLWKSPEM